VLLGAKALDSPAMSHAGSSRSLVNAQGLGAKGVASDPQAVLFEKMLEKTFGPRAEFVRDADPPKQDEDEDIDLPDFIVGDDDEADDGGDKFDEELPELRHDGGDPLDDSTASDLDIGVHIADDDRRELAADANDELVDIGAIDDEFARLDDAESALGEERENEGFVEDDEFASFDDDKGDDDGGSEGTGEDAANDVDENALPELDESENDQADESLADELLEEATRARLPAWAASRFVQLEGAGASVPCGVVTVAGGLVWAAGDVLLTVDEGAHAARHGSLEAPVSALAAMDGLAVLATSRGGLLVSRDGFATSSQVTGFRSTKGPVGLACTPDRVWLLHEGALWSMAAGDAALARVRESGLRAMWAASGTLVTISSENEGVFVEKLRGDDEPRQPTALPSEVAKFVLEVHRPIVVATAGGKRLALGSQDGLYLSNDGGASFFRVEVPGIAAACFAGDDLGADLLVMVAAPGEASAHLIRVTDDGEAARLAEVRGTQENGAFGDVSIAWDASRELVWIASRHGLAAWGPARRH
jgi:hypothetical protein